MHLSESQRERIKMLEFALIGKGIITNSAHYQLGPNDATRPTTSDLQATQQNGPEGAPSSASGPLDDGPDEGVHL